MLEHRKCSPTQQEKILIYHQISPVGWLQQMAPTKSSNPPWQILGICKSTLHWLFCTRLFACTKWCYQWLWMYVYLCVAVMLTLLLLPNFVRITHRRKIFAPQISATCTCIHCICICLQRVYVSVAKKFICTHTGLSARCMVIPLKHALRVYAAHQRKREVNLVSVWSVLSDREGLYFWRLYGEIYKLIRAAFHTYMNFCFKQTLYFLSWLLCLMHLSLYAAACIFDLTNLALLYMCQGVQQGWNWPTPNLKRLLLYPHIPFFRHHEAYEVLAYHVVTKRWWS